MPPQHHYLDSLSHRHTTSRTNKLSTHYSGSLGMALQSCRPRSVSLHSPLPDKGLLDSHGRYLCEQNDAAFDNVIQQPYDLSKIHPQNHDTVLAAILKQLDHLMASRNICRHFMLRTCAAQQCASVHNAAFRDAFMEPLFGDAYRLSRLPQQDSNRSYTAREDVATGAQADKAPKPPGYISTEDRYQSDIISFETPSTLNIAAGLYIPPSPSTHLSTGASTEMRAEKSDMQPETNSEEVRLRHSVTEFSSTLHSHRGRRQRLLAVRDRLSFWGKSAWRRSTMMTQEKLQDESEVIPEQAR